MKRKYLPDLARDGADCDANYVKLCLLLRDMDEIDRVEFGIPFNKPDTAHISIEVLERCPYTTFLVLRFSNVSKTLTNQLLGPRTMYIRLYHDVKTAEVTGCDTVRRAQARYEYPNESMHHPDEKSQMNSFLGEVLSHCLENGHTLDWLFERDHELQDTR